jgi:DNA-directed RNA polymerase subunit H (RpoH/RPB5)
MAHQSERINQIYKSRETILNLLLEQGFVVDNYIGFKKNEVDTMYQTKQLDMLVKTADGGDGGDANLSRKTYVKYHLEKSLRPVNLYEYIDDLFNLEEVLKKTDNLLIIMNDEPNETTLKTLRNIWEQDNVFIILFNINRLQYNVTEIALVPKHTVLNQKEADEVKVKYNIQEDSQIPGISRFDPVAQAIGMRPGDLCRIIRPSKTAVNTLFYRVCTA